ncbi:MAG: metal-dependent transcriptional regulator [Candidatus Lokiarchaeota archaeon]|nr:metal-dependent transcriptional regulator [Candidatus Lokiarchaeota archaeon]
MCDLRELTRAMEEYLEIIYALENVHGEASVTAIAESKGVRAPSVTHVLKRLSDSELILYEPYKAVHLTEKGRKIAARLDRTHKILRWFFTLIGVTPDVADADACEFEHIATSETIEKLTQFVEWVKSTEDPKWLERFREFQKGTDN